MFFARNPLIVILSSHRLCYENEDRFVYKCGYTCTINDTQLNVFFSKWCSNLLHMIKLIKSVVMRMDLIKWTTRLGNKWVNLLRSSCFLSLAFGTHLILFWHRSIVLQYGKIGNFISPKPLRNHGLTQKGSVMKFSRWVIGVLCRKCHIHWGSVLDLVPEILAWSGWLLRVINIMHCEKIRMNNKNNSA